MLYTSCPQGRIKSPVDLGAELENGPFPLITDCSSSTKSLAIDHDTSRASGYKTFIHRPKKSVYYFFSNET